jgi:hypothetical protein
MPIRTEQCSEYVNCDITKVPLEQSGMYPFPTGADRIFTERI